MAVKIKLLRMGKIRAPHYRIVVADARTKRDGRAIETIGKYHPVEDPSLIEVDSERAQYWLSVGAQPTEPVRAILRVTGDWQRFRGEAGAEGTLRTAASRPDKKAVFEAAARDAAGESDSPAPTRRGGRRAAAGGEAGERDDAGSSGQQAAAERERAAAEQEQAAAAGAGQPGAQAAARTRGVTAGGTQTSDQPAQTSKG